ncbi:hypothetical protein TRVA0_032S01002 [Trichomonascus vanleenenianus]|uniref:Ssn2p n=1 Tax=Trichomonascus vanleenenianus TaxID=2268995 RepID=UPI003ECA1107
MTVHAENAQSNLFKAGTFNQVSYRVFMSVLPTPDKTLLAQAEWSLRREHPGALVHLSGTELWIFSLFEDASPPAPNQAFNLRETSTGLLLCSTLASTEVAQPASYAALLAALKSMVYYSLISSGAFVPFGSSIISPTTGKLIHIDPAFTATGELYLKVYYEKTDLTRFQKSDLGGGIQSRGTIKLVLAPSSSIAEFVELADAPKNVTQFCQLLEMTTGVDFVGSPRNYQFRSWVKVKLDAGVVALWPLELCYWQSTSRIVDKGNDVVSWEDTEDVFQRTEQEVSVMKRVLDSKKSKQTINLPNHHQQQMRPVPQAQNTQPTQPTHQQQQQQQQLPNNRPQATQAPAQHTAAAANANANSSLVYPTPPDPQGLKRDGGADGEGSWGATPGRQEENWGDLDESLFGDEEEITEADFNFFDEPESPKKDRMDIDVTATLETEHDVTAANLSSPKVKGETKSEAQNMVVNKEPSARAPTENSSLSFTIDTMKPVSDAQEAESEDDGKFNSTFAPLKFNPLISKLLDAKYSSGGKFYVPSSVVTMDEGDDSDDNEEPTGAAAPNGFSFPPTINDHDNYDRKINDGNDNTNITTNDMIDGNHHHPSIISNDLFKSKPFHDHPDTIGAPSTPFLTENDQLVQWRHIFTSGPQGVPDPLESIVEPASPAEMSAFESVVNTLSQQVVWDDGLYTGLLPSAPKLESPDEAIVKRLASIFPEVTKLTLRDIMNLSDADAMAAARNTASSGVLPSAGNPGSLPGTQIGTPNPEPDIKRPDDNQPLKETSASNSVTASTTLSLTLDTVTPSQENSIDQRNMGYLPNSASSTPMSSGVPVSLHQQPLQLSHSQQQAQQPQPQQASQSQAQAQSQGPVPPMSAMPSAKQRALVSTIFPIEVPFYSMARNKQLIKARAPILRFWKIFGLAPQDGEKDIAVILLCPSGAGMLASTCAFINFLKTTYEGSGLGKMEFVEIPGVVSSGIAQYHLDSGATPELTMEKVRQLTNQIGPSWLETQHAATTTNLLVLMVNPFKQVSSLMSLIQVYSDFKDMLLNAGSKSHITLRLVDADTVSAKDTIRMPSQYSMMRFALNIYDRCEIRSDHAVDVVKPCEIDRIDPAFSLSRFPSKIQLRFVPTPSSSLLDEDTLMHIAYAVSKDRRWLAVAWSDQWGETGKVESFCLKRAGARPRAFEDVCAEVWDKTLELISRIPVRWRIALSKSGRMTEEELKVWLSLAEASPQSKITFTYLLNAVISPSMVISGDSALFPFAKNQRSSLGKRTRDGSGTTPKTPQKDTDSPDMYGMATPSALNGNNSLDDNKESEEAVIVDVKDDTYGVILHGPVGIPLMNNAGTTGGSANARTLITGYLLKPSVNGEREQRLFELSLVHCPTAREGSMKSLLQHYRRLASLGGYTGVSPNENTIVPWHVEAVEKMIKVLVWIE